MLKILGQSQIVENYSLIGILPQKNLNYIKLNILNEYYIKNIYFKNDNYYFYLESRIR